VAQTHICTYVHTKHTYIHECMKMHMPTYTGTYIHKCKNMYITHTHTYPYVQYAHTSLHACIHEHTGCNKRYTLQMCHHYTRREQNFHVQKQNSDKAHTSNVEMDDMVRINRSHTCINTHIHTYSHITYIACPHTHTWPAHTHIHMHTGNHVCVHTYIHTHIHTV
jgi:hypothetical protein